MSLQETRLKPNQNLNIKGYTIYRKDRITGDLASGGIAILIQDNLTSRPINLNTNLEALAVEVTSTLKVTICNIYIPPNQPTDLHTIENIINQLPIPYLYY